MPSNVYFDKRIEAAIELADTNGGKGALRTLVVIISKTSPAKRSALWDRWAANINRSIRHLIPEVRRAFDVVEHDKLNPQTDAFDAKAYGERQLAARRSAATVDGELSPE